jgi:hypothetical protein
VLDLSTLGDAADVNPVIKFLPHTWSASPSVDMLPLGVTMPATVPQRSEIPKGLTNYPVYLQITYDTLKNYEESNGYFDFISSKFSTATCEQ